MTTQMPPELMKALIEWADNAAREAVEAARKAFKQQQEKTYQKGWDEATAAMIEAAAAKRPSHTIEKTPSPVMEQEKVEEEASAPPLWNSRNYIEAALKEKPGMRPMEVVHWLAAKYPQANSKTILTQIKRMRKQGAFVSRQDSRLFFAKAAKEAA